MKKVLTFLMAVIMVSLSVGCNKKEDVIKDELLARQVGDFIKVTAMDTSYKALSNNMGMSGAEGRNQYHLNTPSEMFCAKKQDFIFDIGHIEKLGEVHVWNYNEAGKTDNGVKNVSVSYSYDNVTFETLGEFELKRADGNAKQLATNLTDGSFIDFNGKSARFIRLSPQSNHGGASFGLSEVRFYRFKQDVYVGASISASPVEWYNNQQQWNVDPASYNLTNGAGMSDPMSETATMGNNPEYMHTINKLGLGFTFDMKGYYPISKMVIWNYNDPDNLDYGLKNFTIQISDNGTEFFDLKGSYTLPKGNGSNALSASLTVNFDPQIKTRFIRILNEGNYDGAKTGLSEARFYIGTGDFADNAPDWTALFSNYEGSNGYDGLYSVNLDGKDSDTDRLMENQKTFVMFSDTILSSINGESDYRSNVKMINNSGAVLTGGKPDTTKIDFVYPNPAERSALIVPNPLENATHGGKKLYYWMGDVFVIGNKLYAYALKIDTVNPAISGGVGFSQVGADLACFDIVNGNIDFDSLRLVNDVNKKLCNSVVGTDRFYFGGAVFENTAEANALNPDGYYYVYGYLDPKSGGRYLISARFKPDDVENFSKYEFLAADGSWTNNMNNPKKLAANVAPEISVSEIKTGENKGKFALVYTHDTITRDIRIAISDSPSSAFTQAKTIFFHDTTKATLGIGNTTYNAKAHPALSNEREMIISYHINGESWFSYGNVYRPRFVRYAKVPKI